VIYNTIPVLLYHSVGDEPAGDPRFAVSRLSFAEHMDAVEAAGRTTLRVSELASILRHGCPPKGPVMAITFDDGYADTYQAAIALLDRGLQSTVYVTTSEVQTRDRLTRSGVAELASVSRIEVGAHAVHHHHLDELRERELAKEIAPSKRELEEMAGVAVESFAYPYGTYDGRVRRAVIDAGYSSAVAVKDAISHADDDPFAIARWTVTAGTPASLVSEILAGESAPRAWSRERVRTRANRAVRRGRRRVATLAVRH
jgi:peptidoglycan/xylan/chitin deacetylase (PgdA/CDA1 family)